MKDVIYLLYHLLTTTAKLIQPGGSRAVIAENLLLKQQLIIHSRSRQRAPNLTTQDRTVLGFLSLFLNPRRLVRSAVIVKPSTLLHFHNALKKRKYRLLYSPRGGKKPGPKGPSQEVINAIVEMKQRNPRYGCPGSLSKSTWLSVLIWTRTPSGAYWLFTTNPIPACAGLPGSLHSDMQRTVCGALIYFALNRSLQGRTGSWS